MSVIILSEELLERFLICYSVSFIIYDVAISQIIYFHAMKICCYRACTMAY